MEFIVVGNLLVFLALLALLFWMQKKHIAFTRRVFAGLGLGILFGAGLQFIYGKGAITNSTIEYMNIVGVGYVNLLRMIIIPLIMVSIISAILKLKGGTSVGKISVMTIGILIITTMIAALLGILAVNIFGLDATSLQQGQAEMKRLETLTHTMQTVESLSFAKMITDFIPKNPFEDMAGLRSTSTIAVVIFSAFIGIAATGIARKKPEQFAAFSKFMDIAHTIVMRMVTLVLRLTPFGVLAMMAKVIAGSDYEALRQLAIFVIASYFALITMFLVHLLMVSIVGINPIKFVKKITPVLLFAFTSRSSAGAIPLNIQTQTQALGTSEGVANFAASFGATIGQNGCAGVYPAMLAVMIAPSMGVDPFSLSFIIPLLAIISISSFGVAGVGGGATFAALIVLSAINFPIVVATLLISVEPLIDMGRTALNVSGSITAGTITSRLLGQSDMKVFESDSVISVDEDNDITT